MSFLDNLENNLKTLESHDEALDDTRRREGERERALAIAPWAERLKRDPWTGNLMREATVAGRRKRVKVNLAWIDTTLRLEAREHRLELRPTPDGIVAVFLRDGGEVETKRLDLTDDPKKLAEVWISGIE